MQPVLDDLAEPERREEALFRLAGDFDRNDDVLRSADVYAIIAAAW